MIEWKRKAIKEIYDSVCVVTDYLVKNGPYSRWLEMKDADKQPEDEYNHSQLYDRNTEKDVKCIWFAKTNWKPGTLNGFKNYVEEELSPNFLRYKPSLIEIAILKEDSSIRFKLGMARLEAVTSGMAGDTPYIKQKGRLDWFCVGGDQLTMTEAQYKEYGVVAIVNHLGNVLTNYFQAFEKLGELAAPCEELVKRKAALVKELDDEITAKSKACVRKMNIWIEEADEAVMTGVQKEEGDEENGKIVL